MKQNRSVCAEGRSNHIVLNCLYYFFHRSGGHVVISCQGFGKKCSTLFEYGGKNDAIV